MHPPRPIAKERCFGCRWLGYGLTAMALLLSGVLGRASLTHRWGFSEASGTNLVDSVGTANGSIMVQGTADYVRGAGFVRLAGGAWGTADFMQMPGNLVSSLTNVTVEVWATPRAVQNWSRIFDFGPGNGTVQANDFYLSFCIGTSLDQQRMEHDPTPMWRVDTALTTTVSNQYHYVVTWSKTGGPSGGGLAAWYRDGVLAGSTDTGSRVVTNVADAVMFLGRSQFTSDNNASADYNEVRIYSHALSTNEVNFSRANGPDIYIAPPAQAANLVMTTNANSMTLSWAPGAGSSGSVVVMRAGAATSVQPNYGTNYPASASFGGGTDLGGSNYIVFAASGSSVTVSNLNPGTTYFATVYSYSGTGAGTVLNLADAPSASKAAFGVVQAVSISTASQLSLGASAQATLLANYFGGSGSADVTSAATFSSSAPGVISVSAGGTMTAQNFGTAWIIGSYAGLSVSNLVTVVNPLTVNLIHRYPFTTNGNDVVGTAHGTLNGGAAIVNNQLQLSGTTPYLSLPTGIVAGLSNITLEVWMTNSVSSTWARVWDFGSGTTVNMFLAPASGGGTIRHAITISGNTAEQRVNGTANLPINVRKHIVVTQSGATSILYIDGVAVGTNSTMALSPASMGSTTANYLGKSQYADPYLTGSIDEFRIYNSALPASLVLSNFLSGPDALPITPPNTVNDAITVNPGAKALIPVLANDTGPAANPATLQIVSVPINGTAVVNTNTGKILYTHNGSATLSDSFTYRVQGGSGATSAVATVSVTISPNLRLAAPTVSMPAAPPATGYQVVDAFPGLFFEDAVAIHTPPGRTNQIFVVERRGRISYVPDINAALPQRLVFLDITNLMSFDDTVQGERGLLGMAFHPGFATNGIFFIDYTAPGSPYFDRLARFTANPTNLTVNTNTMQILWDVVDEDFNHNGGDLHFGLDGYLYIGTGDEGSQYNARLNSQRIDKDLFSALLRIDVDKKPGSIEPRRSANTTTIYTNTSGFAFYSIPPDNPFVNATNYLGSRTNVDGSLLNTNALRMEIFATGFRHIWRFSIDTNGEIWVGDVGQDWYEEVDVVTNGLNYGWSYYEALTPAISLYPSQTTLLQNPPPAFTNTPPLWFYPHTARAGDPQYKGNSISGGVVYHGGKIPELNGCYLVADFESGNIWSLRRTNGLVATNRIAGKIGVAAFGIDPGNGEVLLANYVDNQIQRLVKVDAGTDAFPQKLSDTGVFADLATLAPNPGVVNYDPIVAFWSDNAIKRRWFCVPDLTNTFTHVTDGVWGLPPGTVWVKHFDFEMNVGNPASRKRLETRFIVKTTNDIYGVSYMWNPAGNEAFLVPDGGTNFPLVVTNGVNVFTQQWAIPSRTECLACHVPVAGHALSFNTRQLNQTSTMNGVTGNQLSSLSAAGYFSNPVSAPQFLPAFARATDTNFSLEYRVRSYFAVNCVQCHQPAGAGPSTWDARPWLSLDQTSLINGTPYNNGANPANKLIIPGDPAHSVVLQRIRANGFSRMPPLATAVIDVGATNLLNEWITTTLTNRQNFAQWQLANFGSTNAANALAAADPDGDGANNYYEYLTQTSPLTNNPLPWRADISVISNNVGVNFPRLANRAFLVEVSTNLIGWTTWDVPANSFYFGAFTQAASVAGPWTPTNRPQFFRVKIFEP